jgi:hypothetical protein
MIAWINGVMVQGSPEEVERYRVIAAEKKTNTKYITIQDDVPDHVKKYWTGSTGWSSKDTKARSWI